MREYYKSDKKKREELKRKKKEEKLNKRLNKKEEVSPIEASEGPAQAQPIEFTGSPEPTSE